MKKILLVDDSVAVVTSWMDLLTKAGYECCSAADGVDGLEAFRAQHPDLIIVDQLMPRMTGLEMIAAVRVESPKVPIVLLTTISSKEMRAKATALGVACYGIKPITQESMMMLVRKLLPNV